MWRKPTPYPFGRPCNNLWDDMLQDRSAPHDLLSKSSAGERSARKVGVSENSYPAFPQVESHLLHGTNSKALIRCTDWPPARSRPSHADQLHVDLWLHGKNVACDAGTHPHSGEEGSWRNGLAHTGVHNTLTVDHQDQMKMVSRFTWTNWAKGKVLRQDEKIRQGEHAGHQ